MSNQIIRPWLLKSETHDKVWGREVWLCNNDEFCGKLLEIDAGNNLSMHFHVNKREVFYVLEGTGTLLWITPADGKLQTLPLTTGSVVEICRTLMHQIEATTDMKIMEFSTHHEDTDSYRVTPSGVKTVR